MLQELIGKTEQIEATTDANFRGAAVQVTDQMSLDDLEALFAEKNSKRLLKQVDRVRSGDSDLISIRDLRNSAYSMITMAIARQRQ